MGKFLGFDLIARALAAVALVASLAPAGAAQVTTGSLQGVVLDPNKAAVAGATVRVINTETNVAREATTNEEGYYRVTNLISGQRYRVEVTAAGFAAQAVENVAVRVATENQADVQLGVQAATETVEVTGGDQQLIQTTQSQNVQNYTPQQLTQLPYGGTIDSLALLTPGVTTPGEGAEFSNGVDISANGNRSRSNNFQIDGQDNNDNSVAGPTLSISNAEAIGDYQVITNTFSAEFGRNAGAQINVVTRSGTNRFRGSLFEFVQNSRLNARSNLEELSEKTAQFLVNNGFSQFGGILDRRGRDPFTYNRFGGSLGGPIVKDKAFFFVTYERGVQRGEGSVSGLGGGVYTPNLEGATLANRAFGTATTGALTATGVGGGPVTAQGVGQLLVAPAVLDTNGDGVPDTFASTNAAGQGVLTPLAIVRDPSTGALTPILGGEQFRFVRTDSTTDQIISRVDWNITERDSIVARYIFDDSDFPLATGSFLAGAIFDVPSRNNNLGVTYTRTLSSRFVNEARFNFSRLDVRFGDPSGTLPGPGLTIQAGNTPGGFLSFRGFGTPNNLPQSRLVDTWQGQDTVTATLGNHAVKLGADIRRQDVENFFLPNFLGTFQFRTGGTLPADTFFNANGTARTGTATGFENFLLGRPARINFALGDPRIQTVQNEYFFFVQDDWRVRPNLTLNMGLRYERTSQPFNPIARRVRERESDPTTAIFNTAFPLETRTFAEIPTDKNNFAPRVGFAWSPNFGFLGERFTNGRTVLRGNFGVSYDPSFFNIVLNTVTAAPFAAAGLVQQTPGATGSLPFPSLPTTTAQLNTTPGTAGGDPRLFNQTRVDPNFRNPYTLSWGGGVQQELYRNTVLEVRYVGNHIIGQFQTMNGNPDLRALAAAGTFVGGNAGLFTGGQVGTPRAGTNANGRVDPNFGVVRTRTNGASSTYHGLQTRFDTRLRSDLVANVNYTLSKTIDNASEIFSTFVGGQTIAIPQNPFDQRGDRGLSGFDQRHVMTANFLYELPFYREQRGVVGKLLGGFQVNGAIRLGSGRPFTPVQFFGNYDAGFDAAFLSGAGPLRPFNGNPDAPQSSIAFGSTAAGLLYGVDVPAGQFIVFDTRQAGSAGTIVSAAQATQQARIVYNDFGLFTNGFAGLADLEAFNLFRTPFGDLGRNTFKGEPFYGVNMSLFKNLRLTEDRRLEFRVEAFNLLNRRNYGIPDDTFTDLSVFNGNTVSTYLNPGPVDLGSSRTLRLGVRLIF